MDGTITHIGTHAELLATVPQYRYLLAADDELDDGAERACDWQEDEDRNRLEVAYDEQEALERERVERQEFVTSEAERPMTTTEWRGKFDEDQTDDLPIDENLPRRREARALLGSLLRPYSRTVALLALVVVVENAARLSVPLLVQRGIDRGIPPIIDGGSAHTLMMVVGCAGRGGAGAGHQQDVLPAAVRPHRAEGAAGVAAPGVPALPATRHQRSTTATPRAGW